MVSWLQKDIRHFSIFIKLKDTILDTVNEHNQVNNLNETSLLPQHVTSSYQSLESNSPLSNRSRELLEKIPIGQRHGIYQSKTSNLETSLLLQHVIYVFVPIFRIK